MQRLEGKSRSLFPNYENAESKLRIFNPESILVDIIGQLEEQFSGLRVRFTLRVFICSLGETKILKTNVAKFIFFLATNQTYI